MNSCFGIQYLDVSRRGIRVVKILFATSEAAPFSKTGGLGDVCGSLPLELARLGHDPVIIMPAFRQALSSGRPVEPTGARFDIPIGRKTVPGTFLRSTLPGDKTTEWACANR